MPFAIDCLLIFRLFFNIKNGLSNFNLIIEKILMRYFENRI